MLFFSIFEITIRKLHFVSDQFGEWDGELWIHHIKNKEGIFINNYDNLIPVKINSEGFRDYEFSEKKNGTYRILMFGDSFIASLGNLVNETSPKYLETFLNKKNSSYEKIEVFNLGVSGYSFTTYYLLLNKTIKKYEPDLVIFNPWFGNDIEQDNIRTDDNYYPHFIVKNDSLVNLGFEKSKVYELNDNIGWFFPYLQRFVYYKLQNVNLNSEKIKLTATSPINIYLKNNSEIYDETWEIIGKLLSESQQLCEKNNVSFVVISQTQPEQLFKGWREKYLEKFEFIKENKLDFKEPDKDLLIVCKTNNISCYSTVDYMILKIIEFNKTNIFPSDPHYNSFGNYIHARFIYEQIESLI